MLSYDHVRVCGTGRDDGVSGSDVVSLTILSSLTSLGCRLKGFARRCDNKPMLELFRVSMTSGTSKRPSAPRLSKGTSRRRREDEDVEVGDSGGDCAEEDAEWGKSDIRDSDLRERGREYLVYNSSLYD